MWTMLAGVPGKLKTLIDRLTATRAANLDKLDANITTRAAASTALSNAVWSDARAGKLDLIGGPVSPADLPVNPSAMFSIVGSGTRSSAGTTVVLDVTGRGVLHQLSTTARAISGIGTVTGTVTVEIDGNPVVLPKSQYGNGSDVSTTEQHVGDQVNHWIESIPFYTSLKVTVAVSSLGGLSGGSISSNWRYRRTA